MAKNNKQTEVINESEVLAEVPAKPFEISDQFLGEIVFYCTEVPQQNGTKKLTKEPGIIQSWSAGNFKPTDGAANLVLFIIKGGAINVKYDVMYSKKPTHGRWCFRHDAI